MPKQRGNKSARGSRRQARMALFAPNPLAVTATSLGLGYSPPKAPEMVYMRSGGHNSGGSVTTKAELGLTVTDFFEYDGGWFPNTGGQEREPCPVYHYFWDIDQNLFNNDYSSTPGFGTTDSTFCRARRVCVYAMPTASPGVNAKTNADQMFTVSAQVPAVGTSEITPEDALATNVQVTNVLPTVNPDWRKVLDVDLQKTFQSGVVRPYFVVPPGSTQASEQCLFSVAVNNPDDGGLFYKEIGQFSNTIKFKVVIHIDQPVQPFNQAKLLVWPNQTFRRPRQDNTSVSSQYPGTSESYTQMAITGKLDKFS